MPQNRILSQVNKDVIRAVNREVSLKARKFSNELLSGVFRAIFRVEQAFEFAEPEVFQLEHDPERIAWSRLDSYKLSNLPVAIANEEVFANRYQLFTEYDFIILADVSRSMMLKWWHTYGATGAPFFSRNELVKSKLYFLKYIVLSFLHAAKKNQFNCWIKLFGRNRVVTYSSRDDPHLEESVLQHIDNHFVRLAGSSESEVPMLPEALRETLEHKKQCIVLCVSDFMDGVPLLANRRGKSGQPRMRLSDFVPLLAEIAYWHRMLVFRINDRNEKHVVPSGGDVAIDNPYYDVETRPGLKGKIDYKVSNTLKKAIDAWQKQLEGVLHSLGINFGMFEAGSLASVDRVIYRLGLVTGV